MQPVTKLWTTKTGEKIRICDMTTGHLHNTIKLLERIAKMKFNRAQEEGFRFLGALNGEMAIESVESALDHMKKEDFLPEIHNDLSNEMYRRQVTKDRLDESAAKLGTELKSDWMNKESALIVEHHRLQQTHHRLLCVAGYLYQKLKISVGDSKDLNIDFQSFLKSRGIDA